MSTDLTPVPAPASPPAPTDPRVPPARFGVRLSAYHQPLRGQAVEVVSFREGSFTRALPTEDEPWRRTQTVRGEWKEADFGWAAEDGRTPAYVVLCNREGEFTQSIPTPAERAAAQARVVEVGMVVPDSGPCPGAFTEIYPGESQPLTPVPGMVYVMRCRTGEAKVVVVALSGAPAPVESANGAAA